MNDNALDVSSTTPNVVYQPALDEPCIFTNTHRKRVSVYWLTWYIRNNPKASLSVAQEKGEAVVKQLEEEIMRKVDLAAEPIKFVDMTVGKGTKQVARLEWVIWYRYAHKVGYGSAWWAAYHPIDRSQLKAINTYTEI